MPTYRRFTPHRKNLHCRLYKPSILYVIRNSWPKRYQYVNDAVGNIVLDRWRLVDSAGSVRLQQGVEQPSSGHQYNQRPESISRHQAFTGELWVYFIISLQYCLFRNTLEVSGKSGFTGGQQHRYLSPGFWQIFWLVIVIKPKRCFIPPIPHRELISIFLTTLWGSSVDRISYH